MRSLRKLRRQEDGMATSEYAVGTVGACGVGGILYTLAKSGFLDSIFKEIFGGISGLLPF